MTTSTTTASPRSIAGTPRSTAAAAAKRLRKQCTAVDCSKVDAGGGFCVAHGGGKKCAFPGCRKGYQTGGFCRQHGGGARCQVEGCGKVDAGRGLCRAHGGGKRCQQVDCTKADVGGGFCTVHGGGKRCAEPGCTKIDQGGGKCRAHGGARRCHHEACTQPARGASGLCSDHGGAQLCARPNCRRIAKAEGSTYCAGCAKKQGIITDDTTFKHEREADHENHDDSMDQQEDVATLHMPPFMDMLARTSLHFDHSPHVADGSMEHFHAFVQAATTADITSPPQYSDDLQGVRSPQRTVNRSVVLDDEHASEDGGNQDESRNYGSCLDNGCSKSFGGRCNCKAGCTCCSRARATERDEAARPEAETSETSAASASTTLPAPSYLQLQRFVVTVNQANVPLNIVKSMLKAVRGVRSVHLRSEEDEETVTTGSAVDATDLDVSVVLRCDPSFNVNDLNVLSLVSLQYEVHETSHVAWSFKEVVLKVADMMCPGNCGRTVMNALQPIASIETANLVFDERCVVARGEMSAQQMCDAVEAVGFEPVVVAEIPLAKRFIFRVVDCASAYLMGDRLRNLLKDVEGVETVVIAAHRAEALVEATLVNSGILLQAAHTRGVMMVEIHGDHVRDLQPSPFDPTSVRDAQPSNEPSDSHRDQASLPSDHICDVKVCPHNGCDQYRVTIAHTAALAVGWSVPGCAMGWGGECTCGEQCKCAGCPEHNPLT